MGWNEIKIKDENSKLLSNLQSKRFYFLHSYHFVTNQNSSKIAYVNYGEDILAVISKDNIYGCQFHPEKSHSAGLNVLKNFRYFIKMLTSRIIPVLLIDKGELYKTINFKNPKYIGDPINTVRILNEKEVDELIILDISSTKNNSTIDWELISHISKECRMPLCYGGGVNSLEKVERLISIGVEKVAIGYSSFSDPELIKKAVKSVGRQSIVGIMDVRKFGFFGKYEVVVLNGTKRTRMTPIEYSNYLLDLGVGEILLQNLDLDGSMKGFDEDLIEMVYKNINVPLTILGGAGSLTDLKSLINKFKVLGVAAGVFLFLKVNIKLYW